MIPLLVHLVFHPHSQSGRQIAESLHAALNEDPAVPGLRIPTRFTLEDGTGLPPVNGDYFSQADRVFVLVLADDYLNAEYDRPLPAGRQDWGPWLGDLYEACKQHPQRRFVPFQLSASAWPLDTKLERVSFARVFDVAAEHQDEWMQQRLLIELIRFLKNEPIASDEPQETTVKAFISYATRDLNQEPEVVRTLIRSLKGDQPVSPWLDAGQIRPGDNFETAIQDGIAKSALLVVLTDTYSSREWCKKEILLAKRLQRPIVLINAVLSQEIRIFPYVGNVPALRWNNNPEAATHLMLKETLRQLQAAITLPGVAHPDDIVLTSPPELATVIAAQGKTFLYPDPPLGQEEVTLLDQAHVVVETPLQRFAHDRPLTQTNIAVSLSESDDRHHYGVGLPHLNQAAIEISRYLLVAGATLCYGGHLGDQGYTLNLFELVRSHPVEGLPPVDRIVNYIGWPLPLTVEQRAHYKTVAKFIRTARPADLSEADAPEFVETIEQFFSDDRSPLHRFAWARGMSDMRETQTQAVQARIVLGGKTGPTIGVQPDGTRQEKWYKSRIPGVLEEVLISLKHQQPVYLIGGFGGCARLVADVLSGRHREEMTWAFQQGAPHAAAMRELYETRGIGWWSYEDMTQFLHDTGIHGLRNGLSVAENQELFETLDLERIVELLLKGLPHVNGRTTL
jgi:hypothetical protein